MQVPLHQPLQIQVPLIATTVANANSIATTTAETSSIATTIVETSSIARANRDTTSSADTSGFSSTIANAVADTKAIANADSIATTTENTSPTANPIAATSVDAKPIADPASDSKPIADFSFNAEPGASTLIKQNTVRTYEDLSALGFTQSQTTVSLTQPETITEESIATTDDELPPTSQSITSTNNTIKTVHLLPTTIATTSANLPSTLTDKIKRFAASITNVTEKQFMEEVNNTTKWSCEPRAEINENNIINHFLNELE
jgi:hypothetical protein